MLCMMLQMMLHVMEGGMIDLSCWGVLVTNGRMDEWMNGQMDGLTDICTSRVAFATEND